MTHPVRLDAAGRWWRFMGMDVDLNSNEIYPQFIRTACLAVKDAVTPEDHDAAEVFVWTAINHPDVDRGCGTCRVSGWCPAQEAAGWLAYEWLTSKARERAQDLHKRVSDCEQRWGLK